MSPNVSRVRLTSNRTDSATEIDADEAQRFLALLDPEAEIFTFQTFDDDKRRADKSLTRVFVGTFDEHREALERLNRKGAGIFVSMNETDGNGRKSENITRIRAVSLDLDGAPIEPVRNFDLKPHIEIESSPGKFHCYWLVDGLDREQFNEVQYAVAAKFDGDPAVAKLTHIARLPGFFHCKGQRFQTRIVRTCDQPRFAAAQIVDDEAFPPLPTPHRLPSSAVLLDPDTPAKTAEAFITRLFVPDGSHPEVWSLRVFRNRYIRWTGPHWETVEDAYVRKRLYNFMHRAMMKKKGFYVPFNVTPQRVNAVEHVLRHMLRLETTVTPPFSIMSSDDDPIEERGLIACSNGLLDVERRELSPHRANYINMNSLPFDYDPAAPRPEHWFRFLHDAWPDDEQCRRTLQEFMGLLLTTDTSLHKGLMVIGPRRSGKGVMARAMRKLYGPENVAHPTIQLAASHFGKSTLIDKPVAIIGDARVDKAGSTNLAETLLSISGEDALTVDIKYEKAWTGTFNTRFVIMSNELPRINDASGALASRFILLTMTKSFFGKEDPDLSDKIATEMPGILNWALRGLKRLRERGRFEQPESSLEHLEMLEDLASPIKAFLRARCLEAPSEKVRVKSLYGAYRDWCEASGHTASSSIAFGRSLRGCVTGISVQGVGQGRTYRGVGLRPE